MITKPRKVARKKSPEQAYIRMTFPMWADVLTASGVNIAAGIPHGARVRYGEAVHEMATSGAFAEFFEELGKRTTARLSATPTAKAVKAAAADPAAFLAQVAATSPELHAALIDAITPAD